MKMDFPRKSNTYTVQYSKQQSINYFEKYDPRVETIIKGYNQLVIQTVDIFPNYTSQYKDFFGDKLDKIGKYIITIKKNKKTKQLDINIIHQKSPISYHFSHHHIGGYHNEKICWGNIEGDIQKIKEYCDWYYAIKYSLELIYDIHFDDNFNDSDWNYKLTGSLIMRNYLNTNQPEKYNEMKIIMNQKLREGWDNVININK